MQAVKIGDVEYPWPEECEFFTKYEGESVFEFQGPFEPIYEYLDELSTPVLRHIRLLAASVAAIHFRNKESFDPGTAF